MDCLLSDINVQAYQSSLASRLITSIFDFKDAHTAVFLWLVLSDKDPTQVVLLLAWYTTAIFADTCMS